MFKYWRNKVNLPLSVLLLVYSFLAFGHLGHAHIYGQADPGFCTTQCTNLGHHDVKPLCKGFPLNLTLGVVTDHLNAGSDGICSHENPQIDESKIFDSEHVFWDLSRAPPV